MNSVRDRATATESDREVTVSGPTIFRVDRSDGHTVIDLEELSDHQQFNSSIA